MEFVTIRIRSQSGNIREKNIFWLQETLRNFVIFLHPASPCTAAPYNIAQKRLQVGQCRNMSNGGSKGRREGSGGKGGGEWREGEEDVGFPGLALYLNR